jgi:5'-deoxynucleotidase YfbR-like HD superfamily hydrolase
MSVLKLHEYYCFDLHKALIMSIIHDAGEVSTGDITHDIKEKNPILDMFLQDLELEYFDNKFKNYKGLMQEFNSEKTVTSTIVKLADVLSVIQYTKAEITLGNKGYMKEVYDSSIKRMNILLKKLKPYLRERVY